MGNSSMCEIQQKITGCQRDVLYKIVEQRQDTKLEFKLEQKASSNLAAEYLGILKMQVISFYSSPILNFPVEISREDNHFKRTFLLSLLSKLTPSSINTQINTYTLAEIKRDGNCNLIAWESQSYQPTLQNLFCLNTVLILKTRI